jgi:hypothetical protein
MKFGTKPSMAFVPLAHWSGRLKRFLPFFLLQKVSVHKQCTRATGADDAVHTVAALNIDP